MRDVLRKELRRGDRVIDAEGTAFTVKDVGPNTLHVQNMKTGRKFRGTTTANWGFMRVPAKDTRKLADASPLARRNYYRQRVNRMRAGGLKSRR